MCVEENGLFYTITCTNQMSSSHAGNPSEDKQRFPSSTPSLNFRKTYLRVTFETFNSKATPVASTPLKSAARSELFYMYFSLSYNCRSKKINNSCGYDFILFTCLEACLWMPPTSNCLQIPFSMTLFSKYKGTTRCDLAISARVILGSSEKFNIT